ncbi:MAG TPA: hypothetical protein VF556_00960 [Pyrinomonadaceae bacterium]|jgi:hypothetical protein
MKNTILKSVLILLSFFIFSAFFGVSISAQTARPEPELSVSGFRLGDEENARQLLQNYSPRYDNERAQPKYLFYNEYGNQVMSLTGFSRERPFLIVAIEVFAVGNSYQNRHYQMKNKSYFETESAFFIGTRQSATSLLFGAANMTEPKEIIQKKGAPEADEKDGKTRVLRYRIDFSNESDTRKANLRQAALKSPKATDSALPFFTSYKAEYHFVKNQLRRFSIALEPADSFTPVF